MIPPLQRTTIPSEQSDPAVSVMAGRVPAIRPPTVRPQTVDAQPVPPVMAPRVRATPTSTQSRQSPRTSPTLPVTERANQAPTP
jgi:hypothetical protein